MYRYISRFTHSAYERGEMQELKVGFGKVGRYECENIVHRMEH